MLNLFSGHSPSVIGMRHLKWRNYSRDKDPEGNNGQTCGQGQCTRPFSNIYPLMPTRFSELTAPGSGCLNPGRPMAVWFTLRSNYIARTPRIGPQCTPDAKGTKERVQQRGRLDGQSEKARESMGNGESAVRKNHDRRFQDILCAPIEVRASGVK